MKCESCDREACYSSSHWLKSGGMIVLYWCEMHALKEAELFDVPEDSFIHTCGDCGFELQIVRPGKYQCVNPKCKVAV